MVESNKISRIYNHYTASSNVAKCTVSLNNLHLQNYNILYSAISVDDYMCT